MQKKIEDSDYISAHILWSRLKSAGIRVEGDSKIFLQVVQGYTKEIREEQKMILDNLIKWDGRDNSL